MHRIAAAALALLTPAVAGAETLYVSNERGNSVSVIDAVVGKVVATWPTGGRPRGITLSKDGRYIYLCASADHAVQVIDRATGKLVAELPSGQDPEQFFLSVDGKTLFVANEDDAALTAVDLASRTVAFQVDVGGEPEGVAQSPDGKWVVVTSEEDNLISWIDVAAKRVADSTTGRGFNADRYAPKACRVHGGRQAIVDLGRSERDGADRGCRDAQDRRHAQLPDPRRQFIPYLAMWHPLYPGWQNGGHRARPRRSYRAH